jgi:excisionase family DNA binding protein
MGSVRCPHCNHVLFTVELPANPTTGHSERPEPGTPLLLRVPEAARLLSVSRSTLYQLVAAGEVPVVRVGRSVRVVRRELERWVQT